MTDININTLTDGKIKGKGIFDILMAATSEHLKKEFQQKRITSSDYAKVYLGSLQAVLAQSVQFALQTELTNAQTALTLSQKALVDEQLAEVSKRIEPNGLADQEVLKVIASKDNILAQTTLTNNQSILATSQNSEIQKRLELNGLADQEVKRVIANTEQIDAQKLLVNQQTAEVSKRLEAGGLLDQEVQKIIATINQTDAQSTLLGTQNTKAASENALTLVQKDKALVEKTILDSKAITAVEEINTQTAKTLLVQNQAASELAKKLNIEESTVGSAYNRTDILPNNKAKLLQEIELLKAKRETEHAQVSDTLSDGLTPVMGTVKRQQDLLAEQKSTYIRNNEFKLANMMLGVHNINVNAGQAVSRIDAKITDADIGNVLTTVRSNLNL